MTLVNLIKVIVDSNDYDQAQKTLSPTGETLERVIQQFIHDVANGRMIGYTDLATSELKQKKEQTFTLAEACKILHISRRTAYRHIKAGSLKTCRKGRLFTVTESDLVRVLNEDFHN